MAKKSISLLPNMPSKSLSLTSKTQVTDLSHIFDNPNVDEAQAAHDALPADHCQKLTQALQSHLSATGNNPPAPTHQDLEGQQEMAESEAIQNTADMSNPPVIPTSAPDKAPAVGQKLGGAPDFSSLGS